MLHDEMRSARRSGLVALERSGATAITAIVYRAGRRHGSVRLLDGTIVEVPDPARRDEMPELVPSIHAVALDGTPATVHHENLGLVAAYLPLSGTFLLAGGEVAAVYGAEVVPLG